MTWSFGRALGHPLKRNLNRWRTDWNILCAFCTLFKCQCIELPIILGEADCFLACIKKRAFISEMPCDQQEYMLYTQMACENLYHRLHLGSVGRNASVKRSQALCRSSQAVFICSVRTELRLVHVAEIVTMSLSRCTMYGGLGVAETDPCMQWIDSQSSHPNMFRLMWGWIQGKCTGKATKMCTISTTQRCGYYASDIESCHLATNILIGPTLHQCSFRWQSQFLGNCRVSNKFPVRAQPQQQFFRLDTPALAVGTQCYTLFGKIDRFLFIQSSFVAYGYRRSFFCYPIWSNTC